MKHDKGDDKFVTSFSERNKSVHFKYTKKTFYWYVLKFSFRIGLSEVNLISDGIELVSNDIFSIVLHWLKT